MGKYHMTIIESQRCDQSHRMVMSHESYRSWLRYVTKKLADGHEDCRRQDT